MYVFEKQNQRKSDKKTPTGNRVLTAKKSNGRAVRTAREFTTAPSAPIHECLVSANLFDTGTGRVIISRRMEDDGIDFSIFLLDVFCLGVTNALYLITPKDEDDRNDDRNIVMRIQRQQYVDIHPDCAVKLVEGAVLYAGDLGFSPHNDYHVARKIFGNINPENCPTEYKFGKGGKPFFVARPSDTPSMCRQIMAKLAAKCGMSGYYIKAPV